MHMRRRLIDLAGLALGAVLLAREVTRAPLVAVTSATLIISTLAWLHRRSTASIGPRNGRFNWQQLSLAVMLGAGLWLGVYVVFVLADVGLGPALELTVPIRADGAAAGASEILRRGLLSSTAIGGLLLPFRARHHRGGRRAPSRILGFEGPPAAPPPAA